MGTLGEIRDPILLFNTFRFDGRRGEQREWLKQQGMANLGGHTRDALLGYEPFNWFPSGLQEAYSPDQFSPAAHLLLQFFHPVPPVLSE